MQNGEIWRDTFQNRNNTMIICEEYLLHNHSIITTWTYQSLVTPFYWALYGDLLDSKVQSHQVIVHMINPRDAVRALEFGSASASVRILSSSFVACSRFNWERPQEFPTQPSLSGFMSALRQSDHLDFLRIGPGWLSQPVQCRGERWAASPALG